MDKGKYRKYLVYIVDFKKETSTVCYNETATQGTLVIKWCDLDSREDSDGYAYRTKF